MITLDWQRYRPLISLLAWLHILFGCAMIVVGIDAAAPRWWIAGEGPSLVIFGIVQLFLYRRASRENAGVR